MAKIDYKQELKWALQEIHEAGKKLGLAKMRLEGTKYDGDISKVTDGLSTLNSRLINELKYI